MASPTMPQVMTDAAARVRQVPGFAHGAVYYPQPNHLKTGPAAVLRDGGGVSGPTVIDNANSEGQVWFGRFTVRILVPSHRDTPREESRIDSLVAPVVDAFDCRGWEGHIMDILPSVEGHVDAIRPIHVIRGETEYAGQYCYAADVVFEAQFTRYPERIPLGDNPMTETTSQLVYQRTGAPGVIHGVPPGDLYTADWDALPPDLKREVKASALYTAVPSEAVRDPLGELTNEAFDKLSAGEKGARTRKVNELREEAERLAAEQDADEEGD